MHMLSLEVIENEESPIQHEHQKSRREDGIAVQIIPNETIINGETGPTLTVENI